MSTQTYPLETPFCVMVDEEVYKQQEESSPVCNDFKPRHIYTLTRAMQVDSEPDPYYKAVHVDYYVPAVMFKIYDKVCPN